MRELKNIQMKKSILIMAAFSFAAGALFTSCDSPSQKIDRAQENVTEANEDLLKAQHDYQMDVEQYRAQKVAVINANNRSIEQFNARIANEKAELRADYTNQIAELERKNSEMKRKLDNYKADRKEDWENFKSEFNKDMDQLGNSLKDLTGTRD